MSKVRVSAPLKTVTVDHDPALFSAGTDVDVEGRSKFLVTGICCTSKIPFVRAILGPHR